MGYQGKSDEEEVGEMGWMVAVSEMVRVVAVDGVSSCVLESL